MSTKDMNLPWSSTEEGHLVQCGSHWLVRIGTVVNKPKRIKKYEDSCVILYLYSGESNSSLGYSLLPKKEFGYVLSQPYYVSLMSDTEHKNPKIVYKDQKIHLYRFNSNREPSYWFLYRGRDAK